MLHRLAFPAMRATSVAGYDWSGPRVFAVCLLKFFFLKEIGAQEKANWDMVNARVRCRCLETILRPHTLDVTSFICVWGQLCSRLSPIVHTLPQYHDFKLLLPGSAELEVR